MGLQDIMPFASPHGGHDKIYMIQMGALTTSATTSTSWRQGEMMLQAVGTGDIDVIPDGIEDVTTNHFIAATSSEHELQLANLTSGAATHAWLVPMYPLTGPDAGQFISQYAVTGSDTLLTTTQKEAILVGDTVGLWRDNVAVTLGENGRFSVNTGGAGLKLIRKLDVNKNDTAMTGNEAVWFVVESDGV